MSTARRHRRRSSTGEEEVANRIYRELLRAHVLTTVAKATKTQDATKTIATTAPSTTAAAAAVVAAFQQELTIPASILHSCALSHAQLASNLARGCHREQQRDLSERVLLAKASLLCRLDKGRESAIAEITAAARAEGLAIDGKLVGGADLEKVLDLWEGHGHNSSEDKMEEEQEQDDDVGCGSPDCSKEEESTSARNLQQLLSACRRGKALLAATADLPARRPVITRAVEPTLPRNQHEDQAEDPYWDYALFQSRKKGGNR